MSFKTDFDGTVMEVQPKITAEWEPCQGCGARVYEGQTPCCKQKSDKAVALKGGQWVRNKNGVMHYVR